MKESYKKPEISIEDTKAILMEFFKTNIIELAEDETGQIARTFSFRTQNKNYFIQFNQGNMSQGFNTEYTFLKRFTDNGIPVRNTITSGEYNGYTYCITEKAVGQSFGKLNTEEAKAVLPEVIDILCRIAVLPIDDTNGFGWLNKQMNGIFKSWKDHLLFVEKEEPGMFYENWHYLFEETFLEKDLFYNCYQKMQDLFHSLPNVRQFVHSGFGHNNVLIDNGKVSAVLDWQDARYGDPVFDLAYMTYWMDSDYALTIINSYISQAENYNIPLDAIQERLACYRYYIGLDAMRYFAKTNNKSAYESTKKILARVEL